MLVRRATTDDISGILKLLVQVCNVHNELRPDLFIKDETKYDEEELKKLIKDDARPIFVCVDESGNVLGHAFCIFEPHFNDKNFANIITLYIDDICVDENARKGGVATALFNFVKEFAKEKGCYNITLNVWDRNDAAHKFYENVGFHIQKLGMEIIIKD